MIDDGPSRANLTNEGGVEGTFRLLRNVTGLWLLARMSSRAGPTQGSVLAFDDLVSLAADAPSRFARFVDPERPCSLEPGDMPARISEFCVAPASREPADDGEVVRCVLESLALKHAETVELLATVTGVAPRELHVVGGGARNALLCRWTASAAGLPVLAGPDEATLVGNLLVQAMALGEIARSARRARSSRASFAPRRLRARAVGPSGRRLGRGSQSCSTGVERLEVGA